jgi:hypothetical protein
VTQPDRIPTKPNNKELESGLNAMVEETSSSWRRPGPHRRAMGLRSARRSRAGFLGASVLRRAGGHRLPREPALYQLRKP